MELVSLHDRSAIEAFVRRRPFVHLFELGDLDERQWPHAVWFGLTEGQAIQQLALLYLGSSVPILVASAAPPTAGMGELLRGLTPLLPARMYAHLDPEFAGCLEDAYDLHSHGLYRKMGLLQPPAKSPVDTSAVELLTEADIPALEALYAEAYPAATFTARAFHPGHYYGIRDRTTVVSAAGLHLISAAYGVAVLGNVATHPAVRGRGYASVVCAALCNHLRQAGIQHIGLLVKSDNPTAIGVYERLGFCSVQTIGAYTLRHRNN